MGGWKELVVTSSKKPPFEPRIPHLLTTAACHAKSNSSLSWKSVIDGSEVDSLTCPKFTMGAKKKDWNQSVQIVEQNVFPDRKQERQLSAFEAIPQYEYNYRSEVLPKAELKGAPRYDKFHLDMSQGAAATLRSSTNNFVGFTENDVPMLATKMSHTTRTQMPIHPNLDGPSHTIWNTGEQDWHISNQVVPKERAAAMETLDQKAALNSTKTKLSMTKTRAYKTPVEIEAVRAQPFPQFCAAENLVVKCGQVADLAAALGSRSGRRRFGD